MATIIPTVWGQCLTVNATFSEQYLANVISFYGLTTAPCGKFFIAANTYLTSAGQGCSLALDFNGQIAAASLVIGSGMTTYCTAAYVTLIDATSSIRAEIDLMQAFYDGAISSSVAVPVYASADGGSRNAAGGWRINAFTLGAQRTAANISACPGSISADFTTTLYDDGTLT